MIIKVLVSPMCFNLNILSLFLRRTACRFFTRPSYIFMGLIKSHVGSHIYQTWAVIRIQPLTLNLSCSANIRFKYFMGFISPSSRCKSTARYVMVNTKHSFDVSSNKKLVGMADLTKPYNTVRRHLRTSKERQV